MQKRNITRNFMILLVTACLLTGCHRNQQLGNAVIDEMNLTEESDYVYIPSIYEYDTDSTWVNSIVMVDKTVLVFCEEYYNRPLSQIMAINADTGVAEEYDIGLVDSRTIRGVAETEKGYVTYSEEYILDEKQKEYELYQWQGAYLTYYDEKFDVIKETDITDFVASVNGFSTFYFDFMATDNDDNAYFYYKNSIHVVDRNGSKTAEIVQNIGSVQDMTLVGNQVMLVYKDKSNETAVAPLDLKNECIGNPLKGIPDCGYYPKLFGGEDDILYLSTADSLFAYHLETSEYEEVLKWLDCDIFGTGLHHYIVVNDQIVTASYKGQAFEIVVLNKVHKADVKEKVTLTVTMLQNDSYIVEQILKFNRKNQDCRLKVKAYTTEDSPEALALAIQQFNMDLIAGDIGDIIIVSEELNYENLASKGALADLGELIEQDEELDKADFIENIIATLSVDGKLYGIVPKFCIVTLVGKSSNVGTADSWNVADVMEMLEAHEESVLMHGMTKRNALKMFLQYSMDSYYDRSTGKCNFDNDNFKTLLKIAASFPDTIENVAIKESDYAKDVQLVEKEYFMTFNALQTYRVLFGEEVNFIGYPVDTGSGSVASVGNGLYCISSSSEHKEAAWQFIRQYLLEEYQNSIGIGIPINKNAFESMLKQEMTEETYGSSNFYGMNIEYEKLSAEDAEYIRKMVYGVTRSDSYDYEMMNIILEEADSFFCGQKSVDEVTAIVQNRIQLYIDEKG